MCNRVWKCNLNLSWYTPYLCFALSFYIFVFPFLCFYLIQVLYWSIKTSKALHFQWDMLRRMHHSGYDVSGTINAVSQCCISLLGRGGVGAPLPSADGQGSHGISKSPEVDFFFQAIRDPSPRHKQICQKHSKKNIYGYGIYYKYECPVVYVVIPLLSAPVEPYMCVLCILGVHNVCIKGKFSHWWLWIYIVQTEWAADSHITTQSSEV